MKTEKQQSAVEFFKEQFNKYYAFSKEEMQTFDMIFNEAKEMEKQRIKNEREEAYNNGYANGQMNAYTN